MRSSEGSCARGGVADVVADPVGGPLSLTAQAETGATESSKGAEGSGGGCGSHGEEVRSVHSAHSCSRHSTGGAAIAVTDPLLKAQAETGATESSKGAENSGGRVRQPW